jgi:hypothetical protein
MLRRFAYEISPSSEGFRIIFNKLLRILSTLWRVVHVPFARLCSSVFFKKKLINSKTPSEIKIEKYAEKVILMLHD